MYRDKVTEIIDRLQLKYEEEMEEIRDKLAASVTGFFYVGIMSDYATINPLPALTYQSVLDLNAACRSKRTKAYWLFSS
jgi:hypothetical protein